MRPSACQGTGCRFVRPLERLDQRSSALGPSWPERRTQARCPRGNTPVTPEPKRRDELSGTHRLITLALADRRRTTEHD
jgi:hypothetical protein